MPQTFHVQYSASYSVEGACELSIFGQLDPMWRRAGEAGHVPQHCSTVGGKPRESPAALHTGVASCVAYGSGQLRCIRESPAVPGTQEPALPVDRCACTQPSSLPRMFGARALPSPTTARPAVLLPGRPAPRAETVDKTLRQRDMTGLALQAALDVNRLEKEEKELSKRLKEEEEALSKARENTAEATGDAKDSPGPQVRDPKVHEARVLRYKLEIQEKKDGKKAFERKRDDLVKAAKEANAEARAAGHVEAAATDAAAIASTMVILSRRRRALQLAIDHVLEEHSGVWGGKSAAQCC